MIFLQWSFMDDHVKFIEKQTRLQALSAWWLDGRKGRITSSVARKLFTKNEHDSPISASPVLTLSVLLRVSSGLVLIKFWTTGPWAVYSVRHSHIQSIDLQTCFMCCLFFCFHVFLFLYIFLISLFSFSAFLFILSYLFFSIDLQSKHAFKSKSHKMFFF